MAQKWDDEDDTPGAGKKGTSGSRVSSPKRTGASVVKAGGYGTKIGGAKSTGTKPSGSGTKKTIPLTPNPFQALFDIPQPNPAIDDSDDENLLHIINRVKQALVSSKGKKPTTTNPADSTKKTWGQKKRQSPISVKKRVTIGTVN